MSPRYERENYLLSSRNKLSETSSNQIVKSKDSIADLSDCLERGDEPRVCWNFVELPSEAQQSLHLRDKLRIPN